MKTDKEFLPLELAAALLGKTKKDRDAKKVNDLIRSENKKLDQFILDRRNKVINLPEGMTGESFKRFRKYM